MGPYVETKEFLGGFAVVDVADDEAAKMWAGKVAEACGWPQASVVPTIRKPACSNIDLVPTNAVVRSIRP